MTNPNKVAQAVEAAVQDIIEKSLVEQAKAYLLKASQTQTRLRAQIEAIEKQDTLIEAYSEALLEGLRDGSFIDAANVIAFHSAPEQAAIRSILGTY